MIQTAVRNEQILINSQKNIRQTGAEAERKTAVPQRKQPWLSYTNESRSWRARIQLPSWMSQAVYDIQFNTTMYSWSFACQSYNIISPESDIVQTIQRGDKDGVLKLFDTRMASPFDKDHRGYSLLYVSEMALSLMPSSNALTVRSTKETIRNMSSSSQTGTQGVSYRSSR